MIYTSLFAIQNWLNYKDFILKDIKYYQNYDDHLENKLQFFLVRIQI